MGLSPDNKVSDNGYYRGEVNQLTTEFGGKLSRLLGIQGTFDQAMDDRLFRGYSPYLSEDGKEQKLVLRIDKDRIGAVDWTFTRPKSVSVAKLVGGDSRIDEVETRAELKAIKLIESQARVRVRKQAEIAKGDKRWKFPERVTGNMLYVRYRHPSSRECDPHSHTHVKIFNLSYDAVEKNFKAIELRYVDRTKANDIYRAELRKGLNELGYKTETVGQEFEICGFPAEVKARYSQRNGQIVERQREREEQTGKPMSTRSKAKLSVIDRPDKPPDMPLEERRRDWVKRITHEQYDGLRGLVTKARKAVERSRWMGRIRDHSHQLRQVIEREAPEREQDRGRAR